jgi:hypothetical protein
MEEHNETDLISGYTQAILTAINDFGDTTTTLFEWASSVSNEFIITDNDSQDNEKYAGNMIWLGCVAQDNFNYIKGTSKWVFRNYNAEDPDKSRIVTHDPNPWSKTYKTDHQVWDTLPRN